MTFSKYQLNKMEQMLKAIHNPNFEENLKKAADKLKQQEQDKFSEIKNESDFKEFVKWKKNKNPEMDLVKEINKGVKDES